LLEWFLEKLGKNEGGRTKSFSQEARALLLNYPYPGNVRELKNIVEGSYYSTPGSLIEVGHLPVQVREGEGELTSWEPAPAAWQVYKKIRDGTGSFDLLVKRPFLDRKIGSGQVRQIVHLALAETCGRYRDAFRLLGISEREYAIMIQFLKRNGCYLDFRPYRKSSR
jgi:DNA-binding NtrC family response regulator